MTNIFIDLEFTGLHQHTTPISLGIVADTDNGYRAFYGEFTDYDHSQVNSWIEDNVISNLGSDNINIENVQYIRGTSDEICAELRIWLNSFNDQITVYADCGHYDFVLFIQLFGDAFSLPPYIAPAYVDINTIIADDYNITIDKAFDFSRKELFDDIVCNCDDFDEMLQLSDLFITEKTAQHNALWDAYVSYVIYNALKTKEFDEFLNDVYNELFE